MTPWRITPSWLPGIRKDEFQRYFFDTLKTSNVEVWRKITGQEAESLSSARKAQRQIHQHTGTILRLPVAGIIVRLIDSVCHTGFPTRYSQKGNG